MSALDRIEREIMPCLSHPLEPSETCEECQEKRGLVAALADLRALADVAQRVAGYDEQGHTVWELGAGQDFTFWTEEKNKLRATLARVIGEDTT
ncbi:MAG: hypothetical protein OEV62_03280 [Actinomycetota bacterium]|nr:hypothetical protein [Actinomycetota bacterium]